ncbi:hypothetical protein SLEP1_g20909 [Rubroshorea leprosula]|uniref:Uncharacterized protein n=1 Tax=Rubroshorea leprosula TaxID=152421 RepID=A0AAV5JES7_9ROSI|nr:hypothetical protein SLEP1_g20909 [Rubroshorea leprosula]
MDLPREVDDYIKETIDDSLDLPISASTLKSKLRATEEVQRRLREQYLLLLSKLKEKDEIIDRARAEASLNAQAIKKFVEENQKLAAECANLLNQCKKWEKECSLYDHDREALMDFGNEADERAKEAEIRVQELKEELRRLRDELRFYKHEYETSVDGISSVSTPLEENLLESILSTLITKDEVVSGHAFWEANGSHESCQRLLNMWNSLRPSTKKVFALVAKVKTLEKDKEHLQRNKEHLRMNLDKAEEEVKVLFEENNILNEENKRLLRQHHKDINHHGSGGKNTGSASAKSNKRKSSPKMSSSPIEKKIDFGDVESVRQPLSPLRYNSPDSGMHKK